MSSKTQGKAIRSKISDLFYPVDVFNSQPQISDTTNTGIENIHPIIQSIINQNSILIEGLKLLDQQLIDRNMIFDKVESNKALTAKHIPEPELYGTFLNPQSYLQSVNLLIASTFEAEHRDEVIKRKIIPQIKTCNQLLDIGIGNGEATKFLGTFFQEITIIDNSIDALNNIESNFFEPEKSIIKIHHSILDADIPYNNYNLIMMSHTLYYIPVESRPFLIDKLYNHLSNEGKLVFIFNEGKDRHDLTSHFRGTNYLFSNFINYSIEKYNATIISNDEIIRAKDLNVMMHIAGVCLKDASANATKEDLSNYLRSNHYNDENGFYEINMVQKFVVIGKVFEYDIS